VTDPLLQWSAASPGWVADAIVCESPNQDDRPDGAEIAIVVLHFISLPAGVLGGDAVLALFQNRLNQHSNATLQALSSLKVSAHFFIRRDGTLVQCVPCHRRAWHAGYSSWGGRSRCNDYSIGIELEGAEMFPFEEAQYVTLEKLLQIIRERFPIEDVVGHEHIAPGRKIDPGPTFDWFRVGQSRRS